MKTKSCIVSVLIILFFAISAKAIGTDGNFNPPDTLRLEPGEKGGEEKEYELLIFDPDFDRWFKMSSRPIGFYEKDYLNNWNRQLSVQWNNAVSTTSRVRCRPEVYLDYDARADYDKELEYKLFYYFRFMQERCGIFTSYPSGWR